MPPEPAVVEIDVTSARGVGWGPGLGLGGGVGWGPGLGLGGGGCGPGLGWVGLQVALWSRSMHAHTVGVHAHTVGVHAYRRFACSCHTYMTYIHDIDT